MKKVICAVCAVLMLLAACSCSNEGVWPELVVEIGNTVPGISVMTVQWFVGDKQAGSTDIEVGSGENGVSAGPFTVRLGRRDLPDGELPEEVTLLVRVSRDGGDMLDAAQVSLPLRFAEHYYYVLTCLNGIYSLEKYK